MSPNNQNYCGVSYFWIVTRTENKRSLGQNDTAWLGQNDTVWNNLIWLLGLSVLKHIYGIFIETVYSYHKKIKWYCYVRKVPFHFSECWKWLVNCIILPRGKTWKPMNGNKCDSENCSCSIVFQLFNCVYSYFCGTSWIFESEMRKVLLYQFYCISLIVSFWPVHGAKWYSWAHILNGWFQALMSLYVCFSFSQVIANTWQCIIHFKAKRYIQP